MTRIWPVLAPVAVLTLLAAGCSGGPAPATTSSTPAATSSSAGLAPPVANPLSLDKVKDNPCTLLKPDQLAAVGAQPQGTQGSNLVGKSCRWLPAETLTGATIELTMDVDHGGLESIYQKKASYPFFEAAQVGGFPSVRSGDQPELTRGTCDSHVGVGKDAVVFLQLIMRNNNSPEYKTPCVVSDRLAAQVIENIKAAG